MNPETELQYDGCTVSRIRKERNGIWLLTCRTDRNEVKIQWKIDCARCSFRFFSSLKVDRKLPPDWDAAVRFEYSRNIPAISLVDAADGNLLSFAVSAAQAVVELRAGVVEENSKLDCSIKIENIDTGTEFQVCMDCRNVPYWESYSGVIRELSSPVMVPQAAFFPVFSSWYAFHQNLAAEELEKLCPQMLELGLKTIIVDDGWQCNDASRGYAYCGDWEISPERFPDFAGHLEKVHRMGIKYVLWAALPLLGEKSAHYSRFQKFCFKHQPGLKCGVLDPRYPEVREYLTERMVSLARLGIDGLKLDFLDSVADSEAGERKSGQDCDTTAAGMDLLLSAIFRECRKISPEFMFEFRQQYFGFEMQKYGTMFRAADCPADVLSNRIRTLELRLACPGKAIHSDMLMWSPESTPGEAALQILNCIFTVPQISVRLEQLSAEHAQMLKTMLSLFSRYSKTLLHGELKPTAPQFNFPVVYAEDEENFIAVVYAQNAVINLPDLSGRNLLVINAGAPSGNIVINAPSMPPGTVFDALGNVCANYTKGDKGLNIRQIPLGGFFR